MSPSATPATQRAAASTASFGNPVRHQSRPSAVSATPATQSERRCHQVPHLPRKVKVHVAKCHACHAKRQSMSPSATPATQRAAASTASFGNPVRHQSRPSAVSATPATQSERRRHQGPRLPRSFGNPVRHQSRPSAVSGRVWTSCVCEQVVCGQVVCEQVVSCVRTRCV